MKHETYIAIFENEQNHWWYRVRRLLVTKYIMRTSQGKNTTVLDVGCGTGALMCELKAVADVEGVDLSREAVNFCKERGLLKVRTGSINNLPYKDSTFDIVLALDVLEHLNDDLCGAREIRRVLKPDGRALIFVPAFQILWGRTDYVSKHHRRYRKKELARVLGNAGLTVNYLTYFNFFLFVPILTTRIISRFLRKDFVDEYRPNNRIVNRALYQIFRFESILIPHVKFPFGVSIMASCVKK